MMTAAMLVTAFVLAVCVTAYVKGEVYPRAALVFGITAAVGALGYFAGSYPA